MTKLRFSFEFGWYVYDETNKVYYKGCGDTDDRLDFAEFFDSKVEAFDYANRYGMKVSNPPTGKQFFSIENADGEIVEIGLNSLTREEAINALIDSWNKEKTINIDGITSTTPLVVKEKYINNLDYYVKISAKKYWCRIVPSWRQEYVCR